MKNDKQIKLLLIERTKENITETCIRGICGALGTETYFLYSYNTKSYKRKIIKNHDKLKIALNELFMPSSKHAGCYWWPLNTKGQKCRLILLDLMEAMVKSGDL